MIFIVIMASSALTVSIIITKIEKKCKWLAGENSAFICVSAFNIERRKTWPKKKRIIGMNITLPEMMGKWHLTMVMCHINQK